MSNNSFSFDNILVTHYSHVVTLESATYLYTWDWGKVATYNLKVQWIILLKEVNRLE